MGNIIDTKPLFIKQNQDFEFDEIACIEKSKQDIHFFKFLYEKYYEQIFLFIYNRVDDKDLAKDITAEVFLKAMLNLNSYKYKQFPFSSWLYQITRNLLIDLFKKNKKTRTVNINTEALSVYINEVEDFDFNLHSEQLMKLLKELKEDELFLIEMRFFEGKSFKQISEIVMSTEAAIKMKLYRLLEKLKNQFNK